MKLTEASVAASLIRPRSCRKAVSAASRDWLGNVAANASPSEMYPSDRTRLRRLSSRDRSFYPNSIVSGRAARRAAFWDNLLRGIAYLRYLRYSVTAQVWATSGGFQPGDQDG